MQMCQGIVSKVNEDNHWQQTRERRGTVGAVFNQQPFGLRVDCNTCKHCRAAKFQKYYRQTHQETYDVRCGSERGDQVSFQPQYGLDLNSLVQLSTRY